ncbi:MAG: hypothetical protein IPL83_00475 [Bdellovibrionales bacterium]|nr:hypothetical protein [Bdellovibrionales bacterium]
MKTQNNPLIRKTDYWTAIPFIPENLQPSSSVQNYYAAYFWIGMEIDLKRFDIRSGYCMEEYPLNLVDLSEEQLIELITPYLEKVENLDTPRFDCKNPRINSDGSSITGSSAGGNLSKREILEYGYQYLHVATPLFLEIIKLPSASLSQKDLFNLAYKLYGNAWTAIGVISMMSAWESLIDRPGASMLASKVQPIIKNTNDMTGTTYHFWNYFTRGILFQSGLEIVSWGYETEAKPIK